MALNFKKNKAERMSALVNPDENLSAADISAIVKRWKSDPKSTAGSYKVVEIEPGIFRIENSTITKRNSLYIQVPFEI